VIDDVDEPEYLGDRRFFDFADRSGLPPAGTLAGATGLQAAEAPFATDLVRNVAIAWHTPYADLTCEQVRLLLGQKMGLSVLALPIMSFIQRCPHAPITNYAGEMELLALRAAEDFLPEARDAYRSWLAGDFSWMDEVFGWSRPRARDAQEALAAARARAGLP
jgi:hypothetical protein